MSHLDITTMIGCVNQCSYCPQDLFTKSYLKENNIRRMSLKLFKECLRKVPKFVEIRFAGFTEPFLNQDCSSMILFAHEMNFPIRVYTTLIGLEVEHIDLLKKIPFERFAVHLPENNGQTKIKVDKKYIQVLKKLLKSNIKGLTFVNVFKNLDIDYRVKPILDQQEIQFWTLNSRANNLENIDDIPEVDAIKRKSGKILGCNKFSKENIFFGGNLLPNGDVVMCCQDWGLEYKIGNLLVSDLNNFKNTEEYRKINNQLNNPNSEIICRYCRYCSQLKDSSP